jgi:hypothetical protein
MRGAKNEPIREAQKQGYAFVSERGVGSDAEWPPEDSVLIIGMGRDDAIEIGRLFGQIAVVYTERERPVELLSVTRRNLFCEFSHESFGDFSHCDQPSKLWGAPLRRDRILGCLGGPSILSRSARGCRRHIGESQARVLGLCPRPGSLTLMCEDGLADVTYAAHLYARPDASFVTGTPSSLPADWQFGDQSQSSPPIARLILTKNAFDGEKIVARYN